MVQFPSFISRLPCQSSVRATSLASIQYRISLAFLKSVFRHKTCSYGYSSYSAMQKPVKISGVEEDKSTRRIYIIGIGNVGRLFAHSIGRLPSRPPVTLLLHRPSLAQDFQSAGEAIEITTNGVSNIIGGFEYEVLGSSSESLPNAMIHNLIVTTKATHTLSAISTIKNRLSAESTILFTQNGMGTTDQVTNALFPSPSSRPLYLTSVIFHGIHSTGPFSSIHAGQGFINISAPDPRPASLPSRDPSQHIHLLSTVLALPAVNAVEVSPAELLLIQLEKLVVNSIINPLTALFRIRNKDLYSHPELAPLIDSLIAETRAVILALPELRDPAAAGITREEVARRFGAPELAKLVREKALMTGENRSSMLADAEAGRETEIGFINGWVVDKGREVGIQVPVSERAVELVLKRRGIGDEGGRGGVWRFRGGKIIDHVNCKYAHQI